MDLSSLQVIQLVCSKNLVISEIVRPFEQDKSPPSDGEMFLKFDNSRHIFVISSEMVKK